MSNKKLWNFLPYNPCWPVLSFLLVSFVKSYSQHHNGLETMHCTIQLLIKLCARSFMSPDMPVTINFCKASFA